MNTQPYTDKFTNKLEIFNEVAVFMICSFSQVFFAAYPNDLMELDLKEKISYLIFGIILVTLAINMIPMFLSMTNDIVNKIKDFFYFSKNGIKSLVSRRRRENLVEKFPQQLGFLKE